MMIFSTFVVFKHHLEVIHIVSQCYVLSRIVGSRNAFFNGYLTKYHKAVKNNSCYNNNMFNIKPYFKGLNNTQYVLYQMQRIYFNACKNVEYQMIKKTSIITIDELLMMKTMLQSVEI